MTTYLFMPRLLRRMLTLVIFCVLPWAMTSPMGVRTIAAPSLLSRLPVYVALGASDSYGVGVDDPATQSWPAVFASRLPNGSHFIDLGVPSILLHRATMVELPVALDVHPTLVTVWLAVNDLAGGVSLAFYRHDLDLLLSSLQRRTHARVLVGNLPDLARIPAFSGYPGLASVLSDWNAAIATEVQRHGAVLVDLYRHWHELTQHPEYIGPDGLHPSAAGYARLAALFWQATLTPAVRR